MKKLLALLMAAVMLLAMTACGMNSASAAAAEAPAADKTVAAGETWHVEENCSVAGLELEEGAAVEADYPVIVFYEASETVSNGEVIGNVQFVCDYDEVVAIVHTNDTHGFLETEPYVKGLKNQLEASGDYSLVLAVNAGDVYAGGYAAAHAYEGEYIPYIMSMIYDYMTWGNNDAGLTNQGIQTYLLAALGNRAGLTTLLANQNASEDIDLNAYLQSYEPAVGAEELAALYPDSVTLNEDGTLTWADFSDYTLAAGDNALDDTAVVTTALGTQLGLYGISTQGGSITDAYFAGGQSSVTVSQTCADSLREQGATVVVGICHTGWFSADSTEPSSNDTNSAQIALKTTGIDALIDGHTHSVINNGEGSLIPGTADNTIVNQASCKGEAVGVLYLYLKDGVCVAKDADNYTDFEAIEPDAEVQAAVDRCYDKLAADGYTTVYAHTDVFLNACRTSEANVGGGVRANETNLGDLAADGILYEAQQLWEGDPISIALYPGFWVRASVQEGDITLLDAMSVFANPLLIYYNSYTAAELVSAMNSSIAKLGEENNSMYQIAGLSITYDPATLTVTTLTVGDELIYDHGTYLVDDSWSVGAACAKCGGDLTCPEGTMIIPDKDEMARLWCDFLANAEYTIYPNEIGAGGRVVPEE